MHTISFRLRCLALLGLMAAVWGTPAAAAPPAQSTPEGPRIETFQDVNVRSGPGTDYDLVGVLIRGQNVSVLGRSPDGFWVKIVYIGGPDNAGWVYKDLVRVIGDPLAFPTILPPPTPTLPPTNTPAVFLEGTATPGPAQSRLPTFTAPPPLVRSTLLPAAGVTQARSFPPALALISLLVLGISAGLVSLLARSR